MVTFVYNFSGIMEGRATIKAGKQKDIEMIGISEFARRYTKDSHHAHFDGSWEELIMLVEANWQHALQSPNNEFAVTVPIPQDAVHRFYATTVLLSPSTPLRAEFSPRCPDEEPYLKVRVPGQNKVPAQAAEIVLYRPGGLSPLPAPPLATYYIVAIKAYPSRIQEPMDPVTMARNFLEKPGGTRATYSAQEFAEAIWYWSQHASIDA